MHLALLCHARHVTPPDPLYVLCSLWLAIQIAKAAKAWPWYTRRSSRAERRFYR